MGTPRRSTVELGGISFGSGPTTARVSSAAGLRNLVTAGNQPRETFDTEFERLKEETDLPPAGIRGFGSSRATTRRERALQDLRQQASQAVAETIEGVSGFTRLGQGRRRQTREVAAAPPTGEQIRNALAPFGLASQGEGDTGQRRRDRFTRRNSQAKSENATTAQIINKFPDLVPAPQRAVDPREAPRGRPSGRGRAGDASGRGEDPVPIGVPNQPTVLGTDPLDRSEVPSILGGGGGGLG